MRATYVHYGAQGARNRATERGGIFDTGFMATESRFAWGEVSWEGNGIGDLGGKTPRIVRDDGNGNMRTNDGVWMRIADPDSPGDGTVPVESGAAPSGQAGVVLSFSHGHDNPGDQNRAFGYDHQDSYKDERALYASLYAIIKIAQDAQWYPPLDQESA